MCSQGKGYLERCFSKLGHHLRDVSHVKIGKGH